MLRRLLPVQARDVNGLDQGGGSGSTEKKLDFGHHAKKVLTHLLKDLLIK